MTRLTPERLFSDPPLLGSAPSQLAFSPDGSVLTYVAVAEDDRERLTLWRYDVATSQSQLWLDPANHEIGSASPETEEEKAERERKRLFATGVTSYHWCPDGSCILVPLDGAGALFDTSAQTLSVFTPAESRQTGFQFSPSGKQISYVRDGDLYVYSRATGDERRLTNDASDTVSNGLAEFIAAEEMHRFSGHWWSADESRIAFTRVDESPIEVARRHDIGADGITMVEQRYPYTGGPNAEVRLGVFDLTADNTAWIDWADATDDYLARVDFAGPRLTVQTQSRNQQTLTLKVQKGAAWETLTEERSSTWVNLHDGFQWLPDGNRFLWLSERGGNQALYLGSSGELRPLSGNIGRVNELLWADNNSAVVRGWQDDPTTSQLWRVDLKSAAHTPLTHDEAAWTEGAVSSDGRHIALRSSTSELPVAIAIANADGQSTRPIYRTDMSDPGGFGPHLASKPEPAFGTLKADDGQTLHYRLTLPNPNAHDHAAPYPAIIHVYGGPGVQRVTRAFPPLLHQLFTDHGFAVLQLDNRGSSNREKRFEDAIFHKLGDAEVADQVCAAKMLAEHPSIDADRIGIYGHSYGGFMTLMALAKHSALFKAGVSVAPVTDWSLYDTHYTERYLGTPSGNPEGYAASGVFEHLDGLTSHLLLIHGMADDNVLFANTTALMAALQKRGTPFELMTYPGSKHALQEPWVSKHYVNLMLDFFGRRL